MSYSAQAGHVGLRTQAAKGTYADPGAVAPNQGLFARVKTGALGTNRDLLVPDPEIGGVRDIPDAYLGAASWSGDYEFYARPNLVALLLANGLGTKAAPVTPGAGGAGTTDHTITPSDGAALPFMSIEEVIGATLEAYNYTDAVVNTLHLESDANGYVSGTVGLIAAKQVAGGTNTLAANQRWDTTPMLVGTMVTVTYNGVALPAKTWSFDLNNNFETDDFRLGSFFLGDLVPKRREVTFGFTIRPQDSSLWRQAVYGSAAATQVSSSGVSLKQQLVLTMQSYENITGASVPYKVALTAPKAIVAPHSFPASGDDVVQNDVTFRVVRPANATALLTAVVSTDLDTIP